MKHPQSNSWRLPTQVLKHQINTPVLSWLNDEGSLTLRLKKFCPGQFSVVVLSEEWAKPDPSEARLLGVAAYQKILLRQVHLKCSDKLYVYARSVIPLSTLKGKHRRLQFLGDKPLGEYLFACPTLKRSRIEWSKLSPTSTLYRTAMAHQAENDAAVWGRRSLFCIDKNPLLVSEFFLPRLFES